MLGLWSSATGGLLLISAVVLRLFVQFSGPEFRLWLQGSPAHDGTAAALQRRPASRLPFHIVSLVGALLPPIGLYLVWVVSMYRNFESVTASHCGARERNFMPSISACIGDHTPQRYIWRLCVSLFVWQRLVAGFVLHKVQTVVTFGDRMQVATSARLVAHTAEQVCLLLLTSVASRENLLLHQVGFGGFAVCSVVNMAVTCRIGQHWHRTMASGDEKKLPAWLGLVEARLSFRWRLAATAFNYCMLAGACFWYLVHAYTCRMHSYSYFAICEWGFVLSNITFHHAEWVELRGVDVSVAISHGKHGASLTKVEGSTT